MKRWKEQGNEDMAELYSQETIRDIKNRYGFRLTKSLGQNFLTDSSIIQKIIEGSGIGSGDTVIEIGPGIGVITREAAEAADEVIAVEIDKQLIPILEETLAGYDNVRVLNQDILKTDINMLTEGKEREHVKIIGNLPYYITTPIIMKLLEDGVKASAITIMMQKEVADRIKASPGGKDYGAISVAVQYYCDVEKVTDVPRDVFVPQPKVDSAVLKLTLKEKNTAEPEDSELFFQCVKAGFGQRRKTLLNSLSGVRGMDKEEIRGILAEAGIDPSRRAETLSISEFADIADIMGRRP